MISWQFILLSSTQNTQFIKKNTWLPGRGKQRRKCVMWFCRTKLQGHELTAGMQNQAKINSNIHHFPSCSFVWVFLLPFILVNLMPGIVFELLNAASGCSHWPAAHSCCLSQIWVLNESWRELCCWAFHGRCHQLCQCSLLTAYSVQRAGDFQADISVKHCKYSFGRSTPSLCLGTGWLWGQQAGGCWCGIWGTWDTFSSEGSRAWNTRPAASEHSPTNRYGSSGCTHISAQCSSGKRGFIYLLFISSSFFSGGVFCNQTLAGGGFHSF